MSQLEIHKSVILPPAMLGMLGGGQLGRLFVIAAHEMGYKVTVLDPDPKSPAGKIADLHICAAFDDPKSLKILADTCEAISTEFENVPSQTLSTLAESTIVRPSAESVAIAQHRVSEKNFLKASGLPVAPYVVVQAEADIPGDDNQIYPAILKVSRFGYDGKGQARVKNAQEALEAFAAFKSEECVLERMMSLDYEVSVVLARDCYGNVEAFNTGENSHLNGILDITIAPARGLDAVNAEAQRLAKLVAQKLDYTGVLGVEFFVCNGELLVNEMAPRPHNSGHFTIDACVTNQFEQQVRVTAGLPLGSAHQHSPAVMVNLLGDVWPDGDEPAWDQVFASSALKLHLYGKQAARSGRKMGHYTVVADLLDTAIQEAMAVRKNLNIG